MAAVGLSPVKLRRAMRAELGRKQEVTERPLHRSPALRKIFKQAAALASADGGSRESKTEILKAETLKLKRRGGRSWGECRRQVAEEA